MYEHPYIIFQYIFLVNINYQHANRNLLVPILIIYTLGPILSALGYFEQFDSWLDKNNPVMVESENLYLKVTFLSGPNFS